MSDTSVRLQKFIADSGVTSRRKAEELIVQGRVKVNGMITALLGTKVDPSIDAVEVDGQVIDPASVDQVYLLMHKPRGVVTTRNDPEGRETVMDLCKEVNERIYPVGRLDYLSEGLLLMTNDGDLANLVMHPKYEVIKVYEVKVFGAVNETILKKLRSGADLPGGKVVPKSVRVISQLPTKTWIEFRLGEGKNREIRKICEAHNVVVDKLKRVAIGGLTVEGISPGGYRYMTKKNVLDALGMKADGTPKFDSPIEYMSPKKSVNVKLKGPQPTTLADDRAFEKFKRETYFETLKNISESKARTVVKERKEFFAEREAMHQKRQARKEARLNRVPQTGNVHAKFVK
ncbi:MAG: pseudouridine synthase [Halobacteriovorax sp.]|nr:pseudouridine synthase [Halobacteriovorax sp.]